MTSKPYFSLFGPAIRPHLYQDVYDSISDGNDIPFEIVFVGHVPPTKTMPDNFRYIYADSNITPCHCWEIAARETRGFLMIPTVDDLRYTRNYLNRFYCYSNMFDLDRVLISSRFRFEYGESYFGVAVDEGGFYELSMSNSPTLGINSLFRKDLWEKLGGLDSRFYGGFADLDMMLRYYYELGMSLFVAPDCAVMELLHAGPKKSSLIRRSGNPRKLLNSLWMRDGVLIKQRTSSIKSFIYD